MAVELSIVLPAYREAPKIAGDVRGAHRFLQRHFPGRGELIVVDDGSPDDTADRAEALRREYRELTVLHNRPNRGKGHALRTGVAASRGRIVMFADVGGCVPYDQALRGIDLVRRGIAFAHGSRRAPGATVEVAPPRYRRAGSRLFSALARRCLGVPRELRDTQCGFKVYDGDVARAVYGECFTDGFMLDIELIRRAVRRGIPIREFPVRWRNDADTRFAPVRGSVANFRQLLRIARILRHG